MAQLWVWDKSTSELRLQRIVDTGARDHLYTAVPKHGPRDSVEREYARIESTVAPVISGLTAGAPVPPRGSIERKSLSLYLISLQYRNPLVRAELQRLVRSMMRAELDRVLKSQDVTPDDIEFIKALGDDPDLTEVDWPEVATFIAVDLANKFRDSFASWQWSLQSFTEDVLVLGDNPMVAVGPAAKPALATLPLSPNTLLVMTPSSDEGRRYQHPDLHPGLVQILRPGERDVTSDTVADGVAFWQWIAADRYVMSNSSERLHEVASSLGQLSTMTGDKAVAMMAALSVPSSRDDHSQAVAGSRFLIKEIFVTEDGQPVAAGMVEIGNIHKSDRLYVPGLGLEVWVDKIVRIAAVNDDLPDLIGLVLGGADTGRLERGMRLVGHS